MHIKPVAISAAFAGGLVGFSVGRASYGRVTFSRTRRLPPVEAIPVHPAVSDTPISDLFKRPRMFDDKGRLVQPPVPSE